MTLLNEAWSIIAAIPSWDSWTISEALGTNGAWLVGLVVTLLGEGILGYTCHASRNEEHRIGFLVLYADCLALRIILRRELRM